MLLGGRPQHNSVDVTAAILWRGYHYSLFEVEIATSCIRGSMR